ncbi:MAG TPA: hypothetical protein VMX54_21385 [Vicinamibacteria bacterium]|nr:hypothetical protein [Vicinamibacteria bacterium]
MPELEARIALRRLEVGLREYCSGIDAALEKLSHGQEGLLTKVPAWCLARREIRMGANREGRGVAIRILPRPDLQEDVVSFEELLTRGDQNRFMAPWQSEGEPSMWSQPGFVMFSGMQLVSLEDPFEAPRLDEPGVIGWGNVRSAEEMFNREKGADDAVHIWSTVLAGMPPGGSFIDGAKRVFDRFAASIRMRLFRERKIHRLLRAHAGLLMPPHKRLLFEHEIYLGDDVRKADFILEREQGAPALLVELEAPVHKVFRKDGNLTQEATHAREQIVEWASFIDQDAKRNASGDLNFLAGPKERLVVIGRGIEQRELMLRQRWSDTNIWTYDVLLAEARTRWNNTVAEQCRLLGRPETRPF